MLDLGIQEFDQLLPMALVLNADGAIRHIGPTLAKMCLTLETGEQFSDHITVHRPRNIKTFSDLSDAIDRPLTVSFRDTGPENLKGVLVKTTAGYILHLRLGLKIEQQIKQFDLKNTDFSPADATLDTLYLLTSNALFMGEATDLASRLHGAKLQAEKQASTDPLTGLSNRRALDGYLKRLMARKTAFGLMQIDLDFFKAANDTFGHAAGDYVLMEVARVLRAETRVSDIVARVGGDEFILVLADVDDVDVLSDIAARIVGHLAEPIAYKDIQIQIGASIGIATRSLKNGETAEHLISLADAALYKSKEQGRGRYTMHLDVA